MKKKEMLIFGIINCTFSWFLGVWFGAMLVLSWIALLAVNGALEAKHISVQLKESVPVVIGVMVVAVVIIVVNLHIYGKKYRELWESLEK